MFELHNRTFELNVYMFELHDRIFESNVCMFELHDRIFELNDYMFELHNRIIDGGFELKDEQFEFWRCWNAICEGLFLAHPL